QPQLDRIRVGEGQLDAELLVLPERGVIAAAHVRLAALDAHRGEKITQFRFAPGAPERRDDIDLRGSGIGAAVAHERFRAPRLARSVRDAREQTTGEYDCPKGNHAAAHRDSWVCDLYGSHTEPARFNARWRARRFAPLPALRLPTSAPATRAACR